MKKAALSFISLCAFCSLFLLLASCATAPLKIDEGLNPAEYFQRAQTAVVDRNDFKTALLYYQAFLERFPDDIQGAAAEYEIAFIHYKTGDLAKAKELFNVLLEKYKGDAAMVLPRWPEVLSRKIIEKIDAPKVAPEKK
ncbi:MAG: tetratricopeptide repeat protein [Spirochaetales bacterium]|nr:MAG: tetratricopeptide repeat protein [Spirochaetales bacterium]